MIGIDCKMLSSACRRSLSFIYFHHSICRSPVVRCSSPFKYEGVGPGGYPRGCTVLVHSAVPRYAQGSARRYPDDCVTLLSSVPFVLDQLYSAAAPSGMRGLVLSNLRETGWGRRHGE